MKPCALKFSMELVAAVLAFSISVRTRLFLVPVEDTSVKIIVDLALFDDLQKVLKLHMNTIGIG